MPASTPASEEEIRAALASVLLRGEDEESVVDGIDGDIVDYLAGMVYESGPEDAEEVGPFLEEYGCDGATIASCSAALRRCAGAAVPEDASNAGCNGTSEVGRSCHGAPPSDGDGAMKLKQGLVSMSAALSDQSEAEVDANRYMWGQDR